jgi:cbb3-type cytochrome oxidase subunit 3
MNNKIKTIFCITFFIFLCNEIFYAQQTRQKKEIKKETIVQPEKK